MSSTYRYRINGALATSDTVFNNIEKICNAAGAWLTFDQHAGKWSVVINRAGTSVRSFDDSNIVGPVSLSGTGLFDLYNSVRVSFPHQDLRDATDFVEIAIPEGDRYPNEPDNVLEINYNIVTNPVQAELLGFIELKQSRQDQIIQFQTDYSNIDLRAGDIIDVTNSVYGLSGDLFRIVTITESDDAEGRLVLNITALQYSDSIYDEDLSRYVRTDENGIRGIGSLDAPSIPEVTKHELTSRPRVVIETTLNTGIADAVEFWYTTQVDVVDDLYRSYALLGTVTPVNGAAFDPGATVTIDVDSLNSTNFYVKARAKNGNATSPFSGVSGLVEFVDTQVTDAIGPDTTTVDSAGNIGTLLGALALMQGVDGLFGGNTASGSLWDKIFDSYNTVMGTDLRSPSVGNLLAQSSSIPVFDTIQASATVSAVETAYNTYAGNPVAWGGPYAQSGNGLELSFVLNVNVTNLLMIVTVPQATYSYQYKDHTGSIITRTGLFAYIPSRIFTKLGSTIIQNNTADWQTQTVTIQLQNAVAGTYTVQMQPLLTYDLDQNGSYDIFPYDFDVATQNGAGVSLTAYGFITGA